MMSTMSLKIYKIIIQQRKVLILFDDMIANTEANKKLGPAATKLFFNRKKIQYVTCFYITVLFHITTKKTC